jgi:omega-6 fatty acid desaturase (delta-12 desaturase)
LQTPPYGFGHIKDGNINEQPHKKYKLKFEMRTGKELILATKPFAKEHREKSWYYLLSTLGIAALLVCLIIWAPSLWIRIPASVAYGLVLVRLFVIYHDFQHHSILTKSKVADYIMTAFGVYILAPQSIWKRSHDYHHKHNSKLFSASIGSYPIVTRQKYKMMSRKERMEYLMVRHPLTILFAYGTMFLYGMCLSSFLSTPKRHWDSLVAVIIHVAASVLVWIFGGWLLWLLLFFIPFFLACALGAYLFYAQHNFPGVVFAANKDWAYEKAALESSSYMLMSPLMNWVTGNIGYHHIHHLNARVPFYRLKETMEAIPELQQAKTTSLSFSDIVACLRLKIWDPEQSRMITLKEFYAQPDVQPARVI